MKQAWWIAASNSKIPAGILIRLYSKCLGSEPRFGDTKDINFGMGLSETSISIPERRDRVLFISMLAVLVLTQFGAIGEKLGLDRYLKANTAKHRTMSLFRQGCYYYNQIVHMTKIELQNFLNCFLDLLGEHKELKEILWVI